MNITDLIQGAVASRTTRFAFELLPPLKGDGTRSVFGAIDPLMDFNPAYINVTFHREALKEDIRPDRKPSSGTSCAAVRARSALSAAIRRKYDVEVGS
ncbi:5,10-methylenetetrahydrofolate reductase, partial [human gut metagenome]